MTKKFIQEFFRPSHLKILLIVLLFILMFPSTAIHTRGSSLPLDYLFFPIMDFGDFILERMSNSSLSIVGGISTSLFVYYIGLFFYIIYLYFLSCIITAIGKVIGMALHKK